MTPSDPPPPEPQPLNLGIILSKGDGGIDSPFFLESELDDQRKEPFEIKADLIATGRTCVIGSSGSGKSYAVGVICEELCKTRVPFVIIDIEGEYSGLKEKYEAIWIGDDEGCDLKWKNKIDLKALANYAPDCPPIIFDLSEADRPREKVNEFLIGIYRVIEKRRTPYLIILEEADRFSPQSHGAERLPIFDEIARRGRKRGLGLMICTQRPSLVDKNILSQCSNQLIGKLVIKNDLNSITQFFSGHGPPNQLTMLKPGEFFALGGLAQEPEKVRIRSRETRHGGITPKLNPTAMRASIEKLLESIQSATPLAVAKPHEIQVEIQGEVVDDDDVKKPSRALESDEMLREKTDFVGEDQQQIPKLLPLQIEDTVDSRDGTGLLGLAPMIEAEAVPRLLRLEKSFKFFGQKESVMRVGLAFRPLIEIGVRIRKGMIKKKFETRYFFLDGVSGKQIELTDRLGLRSGVERLLGLEEGQITILKTLHPDKDLSLIEVASGAKRYEDETRRLLNRLEDLRLVRSTKVGRLKMYRRLVDLPKIELTDSPLLTLNELNSSDGFKLSKTKIKENQIREIVKGMWEGADVESYRQIYYPVYLSELLLNDRKRYVWIDGRTGKEIVDL